MCTCVCVDSITGSVILCVLLFGVLGVGMAV